MDYYSESVKYAREYASKRHQSTNQYYDGKRYVTHLDMVFETARRYEHLLPERYAELVFKACYTHDLIEDCRVTYSEIKDMFGGIVAEITLAVTTGKGRNRREKHNYLYYTDISNTQYATFVKICDRIANVRYSKEKANEGKLKMYKDEYPLFREYLYTEEYNEMWEELDKLLK